MWYGCETNMSLADVVPIILNHLQINFPNQTDIVVTTFVISGRNYLSQDFGKYMIPDLFKDNESFVIHCTGNLQILCTIL